MASPLQHKKLGANDHDNNNNINNTTTDNNDKTQQFIRRHNVAGVSTRAPNKSTRSNMLQLLMLVVSNYKKSGTGGS